MNDVTFGRALASVMLDNKYDREVKGKRTGKLHTKSLYKINTSSKLFSRKEERKNKHYAVSLVVDCSGSMGGSKIELASESAQKLSKHLSTIGIPHNIVLFHAGVYEIKKFDTTYDRFIAIKIRSYLRNGYNEYIYRHDLVEIEPDNKLLKYKHNYLHIGYSHKYKFNEYDSKDSYINHSTLNEKYKYNLIQEGSGDNNDAVALRYATDLILKQKGQRIIIFLSDGQPAPTSSNFQVDVYPDLNYGQIRDVKKEVNDCLKKGVELYSIGIQDDSVNRFYPANRCCSVYDLSQLYDHIIKIIKLNLKRG